MKRKHISYIACSIIAFAVCTIVLSPILWLLFASFRVPRDFLHMPPNFAGSFILTNYTSLLELPRIPRFFQNSITVAVIGAFLCCAMASLLAYSLTRYKFPLRRAFASMYLVLRMLPGIMIILPIFIVVSNVGMLDSLIPLILCYIVAQFPIATWMMQSFFRELPVNIEESAKIDGCNRLQAMMIIAYPLSITGITTTFVFVFINMWNEFFFARLLTITSAVTLPLGILQLTSMYATEWGRIAAFAMLIIAPVLIIAFATQKYLVRGMTMGALKG